MNDHSIQRYSMGWKDVTEAIERRYKLPIDKTNEQFEDKLIQNAISVTRGSIKAKLISFAKELSISHETLREKNTNRGTQRSPFGIGS